MRDILVETIAKIIGNLAWFILIYWSVKTLVKKAPTWLDQYEKIRMKQRAIDNALSKRFIR
jgi:uncharacterized membrane-anchored protein